MVNPALRKARLALVPAVLFAGLAIWWWRHDRRPADAVLHLYGNIDIRTVDMAFNDAGRIQQIGFEEGSRVHKGDVLARIDPLRFQDAADQAAGILAVARQQLAALVAGNRPQQIAEARAAAASAAATLHNAEATYERQRALAAAHLLPQQSADNALQSLKNARAGFESGQQALSLAVQGPRVEDVAAARAQVAADAAALALARRQLHDTTLRAPADGVVQTRILEVGDMASPSTPVLTLALDNPVWARVYVPETELGRVAPGMRADILSDSFPGHRFPGWIGFVSPTAEFTPKSVQTTDLRTELVYRARVYACNPQGRLHLGMPVTVEVPLHGNAPRSIPAHGCPN